MEADTTVTLYNFYGWLHTNRKRVVAGLVVVVVIAASLALYVWYNNQKAVEANGELLDVPMFSTTGQPDASRLEAYGNIAQKYSDTSAGAYAELLAARSAFLDGKYPEAEEGFNKFIADHQDSELIPQARVGVAASLEAQGKLSEAAAKYKEVTAIYSSDVNIALPAKLTLGRLSEAQDKPEAAEASYKELAQLNAPNDPWVAEARDRLIFLLAKHPELNRAPAQQSAPAPGILSPSPSEMQIAPPSAGTDNTPKPAATPPPSQQSQLFQFTTNLPPTAKP